MTRGGLIGVRFEEKAVGTAGRNVNNEESESSLFSPRQIRRQRQVSLGTELVTPGPKGILQL